MKKIILMIACASTILHAAQEGKLASAEQYDVKLKGKDDVSIIIPAEHVEKFSLLNNIFAGEEQKRDAQGRIFYEFPIDAWQGGKSKEEMQSILNILRDLIIIQNHDTRLDALVQMMRKGVSYTRVLQVLDLSNYLGEQEFIDFLVTYFDIWAIVSEKDNPIQDLFKKVKESIFPGAGAQKNFAGLIQNRLKAHTQIVPIFARDKFIKQDELSETPPEFIELQWSPDGQQVAYIDGRRGVIIAEHELQADGYRSNYQFKKEIVMGAQGVWTFDPLFQVKAPQILQNRIHGTWKSLDFGHTIQVRKFNNQEKMMGIGLDFVNTTHLFTYNNRDFSNIFDANYLLCDISSDGKLCICQNDDNTQLILYARNRKTDEFAQSARLALPGVKLARAQWNQQGDYLAALYGEDIENFSGVALWKFDNQSGFWRESNKITQKYGKVIYFAWSPDGQKIALGIENSTMIDGKFGGTVYVVDRQGKEVALPVHTTTPVISIGWSLDNISCAVCIYDQVERQRFFSEQDFQNLSVNQLLLLLLACNARGAGLLRAYIKQLKEIMPTFPKNIQNLFFHTVGFDLSISLPVVPLAPPSERKDK